MKDINKPIRDSWFTLLDGGITIDALSVPVNDEILNIDDNAKNYVLLTSQFSNDAFTKSSFDLEATIELQIISQSESVTKNTVDSIADQILSLLYSTPSTHNLPTPINWQFLDVRLTQDRYINALSTTTNIIRRILQFSFRVVQN